MKAILLLKEKPLIGAISGAYSYIAAMIQHDFWTDSNLLWLVMGKLSIVAGFLIAILTLVLKVREIFKSGNPRA